MQEMYNVVECSHNTVLKQYLILVKVVDAVHVVKVLVSNAIYQFFLFDYIQFIQFERICGGLTSP